MKSATCIRCEIVYPISDMIKVDEDFVIQKKVNLAALKDKYICNECAGKVEVGETELERQERIDDFNWESSGPGDFFDDPIFQYQEKEVGK